MHAVWHSQSVLRTLTLAVAAVRAAAAPPLALVTAVAACLCAASALHSVPSRDHPAVPLWPLAGQPAHRALVAQPTLAQSTRQASDGAQMPAALLQSLPHLVCTAF